MAERCLTKGTGHADQDQAPQCDRTVVTHRDRHCRLQPACARRKQRNDGCGLCRPHRAAEESKGDIGRFCRFHRRCGAQGAQWKRDDGDGPRIGQQCASGDNGQLGRLCLDLDDARRT
ncbi:hypothetical protein D9M72_574990 [compost metagenome]